jgi:hypothetical protein
MAPTTPYPVFLSCGTPHTEAQEAFLAAVEAHLRSHGCVPQTVGRSVFSVRQPVQASRELIGACRGAVVIAFERTVILTGFDKPGSREQKDIANETHPTVWNHMEGAMAYAQEVPMLTLVQRGVKRQGMLSERLEWSALEADLSPALLVTERFQQVFREWLDLVQSEDSVPSKSGLDPASLTVGELLKLLKGPQLWALIATLFGMLGGAAAIAYKVGQAFPPHP